MSAKATISSGYRWRLGVIALAMLAFAGWFFYDGAVGYPATRKLQLEKIETYNQLKETHPSNYTEVWQRVAHEHGWPGDEPGPAKTNTDILAQYLYGIVCVVIGIPFAVVFLRSFGRWIASDEQGLLTSSGQRAAWNDMRSLDTRRWKAKGIAKVHYRDAAGKDRVITLDDWKFERQPVTTMFNEVRERLGIESETAPPLPAPPPEGGEGAEVEATQPQRTV